MTEVKVGGGQWQQFWPEFPDGPIAEPLTQQQQQGDETSAPAADEDTAAGSAD